MIQKLKKEIERELMSIEPGKFQEFCLRFLPIDNEKYAGLTRHGSTYDGKTRKGTPDLIKTSSDGSQIAVECGTEANYWVVTPENIEDSKPVKDGLKCLEKLLSITELVLASSQEVPTNMQNSYSLIIKFFKQKNNHLSVRCLSSQDFAQRLTTDELINNPNTHPLLKDFFPEVWNYFENAQKMDAYNEAAKISSELLDDSFSKIIEHCLKTGQQIPTKEKVKFLKEDIFGLGRFEIRDAPNDLFERDLSFLETHKLKGKIHQLIGIPKIGKSYITHNLRSVCDARLTNTPIAQDEQYTFLKALEAITDQDGINLLIVDNIERFTEENIKSLNAILIQKKSQFKTGVILVSNIHYKHKMSCIDEVIIAPKWSPDELMKLIPHDHVEAEQAIEYFETLASISGGHPLIAKSIAANAKTKSDIYLNKIFSLNPTDEKLSQETSILLFEKTLQTTDEINFVTRLSNCTYSADEIEIEAICGVQPVIKTPVKLILQKIGPTIFEGSISKGFEMNSLFKEVARKVASKTESKLVYSALADSNWRIKNNTIEGYPVIKSIHYLIMAERIDEAYARGMMLTSGLHKENDIKTIEEVISQIDILLLINEEVLLKKAWTYITSVLFKVSTFSLLNRTNSKSRHIDKLLDINVNKLAIFCDEAKVPIKNDIISSVLFSIVFNFEKFKNREKAISQIIDCLNESKGLPEFYKEVFPYFSWSLPLSKPEVSKLFSKLIEIISQYDFKTASAMSSNWGAFFKAKISEEHEGIVLNSFSTKSLLEIFKSSFYELYKFDNTALIDALKKDGIPFEQYDESVLTILADKHYDNKEYDEASRYYSRVISTASKPINFLSGWAPWRLAHIFNIQDDLKESLIQLNQAAKIFKKSGSYGYSYRALGAMVIQNLRIKDYKEAISCAEILFDALFIENRRKAGPTVKVLSAQLLRLKKEFHQLKLQDGLVFPDLDIHYYETFLDTLEVADNGMLPYSFLSHLAFEAGDEKLSSRLLAKALSQPITSDNDKRFLDITAREIFTYKEFDAEIFNNEFISAFAKKLVQSYQIHLKSEYSQEIAFEMFFGEAIRIPKERRHHYSQFFYDLCESQIEYLDKNQEYDSDLIRAFLNYYLFCHGADLGHKREDLQIFINKAIDHASNGNIHFIIIEAFYNKIFNYSDSIPNYATVNHMFLQILKSSILESNFSSRLDNFGERIFSFWSKENLIVNQSRDSDIARFMKQNIQRLNYLNLGDSQKYFFITVQFCILNNFYDPKLKTELITRKRKIEPTLYPGSFALLGDPESFI